MRGIYDPLGKLRLQFGQPRPIWEWWAVTWNAVGGATEGAGSGAVVRSFQGGPGSHEVTETLLQVSWEYINVTGIMWCVTLKSVAFVGFRMVCFMIITGKLLEYVRNKQTSLFNYFNKWHICLTFQRYGFVNVIFFSLSFLMVLLQWWGMYQWPAGNSQQREPI